ncbi:MAG TPA: PhzF family phenazine biosynthesis protein [Nocardioides sp.]|nr:PhzF family phenazine biosynthesis protein [Nocardioides sp.]
MPLHFRQVDVFSPVPLGGNPVAVVHDADGLTDEQMAAFARWTNLSETTFLLRPTDAAADYRVRIFTPGRELPFAGHPTLGSAHAWLEAGGNPQDDTGVVQECGVGLVRLRRGERLAFAAPPSRSEPVDDTALDTACRALELDPADVVDARVLDNGPTFVALRLRDARSVLAVHPDLGAFGDLDVGVVGPHQPGGDAAIEVRVFVPGMGIAEDPVTGSFNAAVAQWLVGDGTLPASYVAAQGTALGRTGRVHVDTDAEGTWVGGDTVTTILGTVDL